MNRSPLSPRRWFRALTSRFFPSTPRNQRLTPFRPAIEGLEERVLLSASVTLNALNNSTTALISYNDGAGDSRSVYAYVSQFNVTETNGGAAPINFNTFCIDLLHDVSVGQTYAVDVRNDLAVPPPTGGFVNGAQMAYIYAQWGMQDLSSNPDQAAAVQIALWDLSLNNHTPTSFGWDSSVNAYDSGDPSVFSVANVSADGDAIAGLVNTYLTAAAGATTQGNWLDASASGDDLDRGQSLMMIPLGTVPNCANCSNPGLAQENPNAIGGNPGGTNMSTSGVRYDGTIFFNMPNLSSLGFGSPFGQTLSWTNQPFATDIADNSPQAGQLGSGWVLTQQPWLMQVGTSVAAVLGADQIVYFDPNGSGGYQARFFLPDTLTHDDATNTFVLTDSSGDVIRFRDFSSANPTNEQGQFLSFTDPGGQVTAVTSNNANGSIADIQRTDAATGLTESYLYTYLTSGPNAGLMSNVTLRRETDGGPWSIVRQVAYSYYDGTSPYGNVGDLETAVIEDASGTELDTYYFRYYTSNGGGGYVHGLEYAFSPTSFARLQTAVGNPFTATNSQVAPYADLALQYDSQQRVTEAVVQGQGCSSCSGGLGTYTYSYTSSDNTVGVNSWATKTIETLPDGNENIVYTNAYGEVMLNVYEDTTTDQQWDSFYKYDDQGRIILMANPSAVTGFDESSPDLLVYEDGGYEFLANNSGLIDLFDYYVSTTATETTAGGVAGYEEDSAIEQGQLGTPILQESFTYFVRGGSDGGTIAPIATDTVYRNDGIGPALGDAGFESPNVGTGAYGDFAYDPSGTAWTFDSSSGVAGNGSGFTSGNPDAPEGTQVGFLQGPDSDISQTVSFAAGGYTLSFYAAQRGNYQPGGDQTVEVLVDGNIVGTFTPSGTGYTLFTTAAFTLTAGSHTITFAGLTSGDSTAFIDALALHADRGAETTSYAYTWFADTTQPQTITTSLPVISAAQNGPGTAAVGTQVFDLNGNVIWTRDAQGFLNYFAYDEATGALVKQIIDVDTTQTGEFMDLPSGWSTPSGGGLNLVTTMQVDALGRTVVETSPNGNVTYTVFDDPDHEERVYEGWDAATGMPTGPTMVYRYDMAGGYYETLTMSAAPALDAAGHPTGTEAISDIQTLSRSYTNAAGQIVREDDYFDLDGVTYSTDPYIGTVNVNYYTTLYGYDADGNLDRTVAPTGTITRMVYDGQGRLVSQWVGTNDTPASGFWSPSNPASMTEVSSYVYDNGGVGDSNLTEEIDYPGGGQAPRVTEYFYDWRDREVAEKDGVETSEDDGSNRPIYVYTYDNLDEVTSTSQYEGDGVTPEIVNGELAPLDPSLLRAYEVDAYDDQGNVYQDSVYSVDPTTGAVSTNALVTNYYYDLRGDQVAESDPGGLWTKDVYDGAGRLVTEYTTDGGSGTTWADASTVANDIVLEEDQYVYDADSNVIETIDRQRFDDASGTGALGDPTSTDAPQARVYYAGSYYDAADRDIADVDVGTNGGTPWVRPDTAPDRSDDVLVTSYVYNAAGWVQDVIDPRGIDTRTLYDALGRTTETIEDYTDGVPTADSNRTTAYTYDGDDNVLTVTAVMPSGTPSQTTEYVYGVSTANGSNINSNDLLAATLYPDPTTGEPSTSQEETYTYDALGDVTSMTDRNGTTHEYEYDVLGRQTADIVTTLGAGVDGSVRRIDTAYDSQGNPYLFTSYADTAGTEIVNQVEDLFNGLGQLTTEYQSVDGAVDTATTPSVQYAYTEMSGDQNNSRLVSITYPNGRVIDYNYNAGLDDAISRLSSISDNTGILESYTYLGLGTVVERDHPQTGVNQTFISQDGSTGDAGDKYTGLDRFGRIVEAAWINAVTGVATDDFTYTYDRDSNVTSEDNLLNADLDQAFTYDNLNQLTSWTRADGQSQNYAIDAVGNFDSVTTNGTTQGRTSNSQNEITGVSGAVTPTYDNNGNLTTDETGQEYVYDAWNRLVAVTDSRGNPIASYSYDALGRRVTETVGGTTTDVYFDSADDVLEERDAGSSNASVQYVWCPVCAANTLVERDADTTGSGVLNQRLYVQQDANQNVTALVDTSGNVVERYTYDPYGQVTVMDGAWNVLAGSAFDSRYLFQGGRYEAAIGDYQFGAREYRPSIQVWTSVDPIGFAGGSSNLYRFVSNNPVNQMDPNGTDIYHASTWENLIFPHQDIRVDTWESRGGKWHRTGTVYYSYGLSQTKTIWAFGRGGQILPLGYDARTLVQVPFTNISITVLVGIVSTGPSKGSYNVVQRLSTTPEQDIAFKAILDRTVGNYGPYSFLGPNSFDGLTCRKHAQLWFGEAKRLFPHVQQYTAPPDFWDNASTNFQRFWEADKPAALANAFNAATEAATPLRSRLNPKLVERFEQLRAQGMSVDQIIIQLKSEGILPK